MASRTRTRTDSTTTFSRSCNRERDSAAHLSRAIRVCTAPRADRPRGGRGDPRAACLPVAGRIGAVALPAWYIPWCIVIDLVVGAGLLVVWRHHGLIYDERSPRSTGAQSDGALARRPNCA